MKDKVVIITGASSGIGEATAKRLAREGVKLMLAARRVERLAQLTYEINNMGGNATYLKTDSTSFRDMKNLIDLTLQTYGRIDVLFNNAGIMMVSPMRDLKVYEWEQMIDVNIKGVLYGIAAVLPVMREQKSGLIINTNSVAGHSVRENIAVYAGTKFAIQAISEGLEKEETSESNILITNISPGPVDTELVEHISNNEIKEQLSTFTKSHGLKADKIADAVAFVISQPKGVSINEIIIKPTHQLK